MYVTFYNFAKTPNETKVPSDGGLQLRCVLKETCSVLQPILETNNPNIAKYNYFYIEQWKRYYFISDVTYLGNQTFRVEGRVDSMGSFRSSILSSNQYIARAATGYDESIPDAFFPAKAGRRRASYQGYPLADVAGDYKQGIFVLGIVGKNAGYSGIPVTYYGMDFAQMALFNDYLFNQGNYGSMISDDIVKAFFNPMDFVVSCVYIPYPVALANFEDGSLDFGWFQADGIFPKIIGPYNYNDASLNHTFTITKPHKDFRDLAPWTQYRLWVGNAYYDLPPEKLYKYSELHISTTLDLVSGLANTDVRLWNSGDDTMSLTRISFQFGAPIALAQLRSDVQGFAESIANAVGSIFKLNPGNMVAEAVSAIDAITPDPSVKGQNGSLGSVMWNNYIELECWTYDTVPLAPNRNGRPVCRFEAINSHEGYVECIAAEVEPPGAYREEIDEINRFMNGGFYAN